MALITQDQLKARMPQYTGTALDTTHTILVDRADSLMAYYCGFPFADGAVRPTLTDQTYTLYIDGPHPFQHRKLDLGIRPIVSITSIHQSSDWDYGAADLVDSGDYVLDSETGEVWIKPDAAEAWQSGPRRIKVVCVAGYADPLDDAHPLVEMCALTVQHLIDRPQVQGRTNVGASGTTLTLNDLNKLIPEAVRHALAPMQLGRGICG